ncbi:hypothetical protein J4211_05125, partial [Candidatus Woesearchaeota archaeon]|nr:hypothetical protein [Candidatus Woesearchaeota archaeon]
RAGVDLDEVLAGHVEPFLEFHRQVYGLRVERSRIVNYLLSDFLGISSDEMRKRFQAFYDSEELEQVVPLPGALKETSALSDKYEFVVITSRPTHWEPKTVAWLRNYFPTFEGPHFAQNGHSFKGGNKKTKLEWCRDLGVEVMVEDNHAYLAGCTDAGVRGVLIDCPWNQEPLPEGVARVWLGRCCKTHSFKRQLPLRTK